jgi:hypothetical protein
MNSYFGIVVAAGLLGLTVAGCAADPSTESPTEAPGASEPASAAGSSSYALGAEQVGVTATLPLGNDGAIQYTYRSGPVERSWTAAANAEGLQEFFGSLSPELKTAMKETLVAEIAAARTQDEATFLEAQQGILEAAESREGLTCGDHWSTRQHGCVRPGVARIYHYWCHGYFWQSCKCDYRYQTSSFSGTCG